MSLPKYVTALLFASAILVTSALADYADAVKADKPSAWWRFDEPAKAHAAAVAEVAGNAAGSEYRGTVATAPGLPGTGGQAVRLNGKDAYVHAPYTKALRSNVLSVEFWFRSTQPFNARFWPGSAIFVSTATAGPGSADWLISAASQRNVDDGRLLAETGPQGKSKDLFLESRANDPLNDGHWHHVVLTRAENGDGRLYVNGELHAQGNDGGGNVISDRAINIGGEAIHGGGKFLAGDMDEVAIYTHVLSAKRVRTHFQAIAPQLGDRPPRRVVKVPAPDIQEVAPNPEPQLPPAKRTPLKRSIAESAARHWAFQPIRKPRIPAGRNTAWVRNPIDAFVLAKLEKSGRTPAKPADSATLLRRAHVDLLGLPPKPEQVVAFSAAPDWPALIESLLGAKQYGERYGRHWLDVARYADSAGYELDNFYYHAPHYRDYVIRAFNDDKPFDQFVREQIAADLLYADDDSLKFATGFYTVGPYAYEGGIKRPKRVEYQRLTDAVDTTGDAFLGLSIGCARCHDHKYDPITQYDYFALQALLGSSEIEKLNVSETVEKDAKVKRGNALMHVLRSRRQAPDVQLLRRGELDHPAGGVAAAIPAALLGGGPLANDGPDDYRLHRVRLAEWIVSTDNPLTARVIVNRVWMWHFGEALVATPNDLGTQGEPPTHPQLLDFLAAYLIDHGWRLKDLHRLIMQSATYQMSSRRGQSADSAESSGGAEVIDHYPRHRLGAEAIWDNLLAVSGVLNLAMYGPAVFPPIDPEMIKSKRNGEWRTPTERNDWARRGIYVASKRSMTYPFFDTFNVVPPIESCGRRDRTVVSPQALTLLNDRITGELAEAFAARLKAECGDDRDKQIERAWLLAFGRPVGDDERRETHDYLKGASMQSWCLALFNTNEFIYVD